MVTGFLSRKGATANDDSQCQVQAFGVLDVATKVYKRAADCNFEEFKNYMCRKAFHGITVDTLTCNLDSMTFQPGESFPARYSAAHAEEERAAERANDRTGILRDASEAAARRI